MSICLIFTKKVIFLVISMKKHEKSDIFSHFHEKSAFFRHFMSICLFFAEKGQKKWFFSCFFLNPVIEAPIAQKKPLKSSKVKNRQKSGFLWRNGFYVENYRGNQWVPFCRKSVWSNFLKISENFWKKGAGNEKKLKKSRSGKAGSKKVTFFVFSWVFVSFSWKKCFFSSFPAKKWLFLSFPWKKWYF